MTTQWEYEFDPYGDNPLNKIVDEAHTITPANGKDFTFFIPRKGPFHRRSVVLRDAVTGNELNLGTDYYFGWRYDDIITSGSVQPVYGAIVMNDPTKTYQVLMDYQNLGGSTMLDDAEIVTLLANTGRDPRRALWTDVVDIPEALPPIPHRESTGVVIGFDSVVEVLYKIADSINSGNVKSMQALMEHVADHHNPHRITLEDLGIDELGNLIPATKEEAEGGTDNTHYMTALRTDQYAKAVILPILNTHVSDQNNPHNVTKSQVGLGSVQNYPVASTTEAEAGVATNRYMTPATSVLLMNSLFKPLVDAHIADKANPHGTTKAQVGLGNVDNYQTATAAEASEGKATNRFMTPYLVGVAIAGQVNAAIDYHTGDFNNPHKTTKAQVGLGSVDNYATASVQDATAGTATDKFMTPYLTANAIIVQAPIAMEFHTNDNNNPHGVTKTQVGLGNVSNYAMATLTEATGATSNERYMSPYLTDQLIAKRLQEAGVGDSVTKESIGLGNVDNYASATTNDMITLNGTKFVTTNVLAAFFQQGGGASTFITKNTVGLNQVQNLPVATVEDMASRNNTTYATPHTVDKMMSDNVVANPILTQQSDTNFDKKPYSLIAPESVMGVEATGDGLVSSYRATDIVDSEQAYFYSKYALSGNKTVVYSLTKPVASAAMSVGMIYLKSKTDDFGYYFGVQIDGTSASLVMMEAGSATPVGTAKTIVAPAANTKISMTVVLTPASGAYNISVLDTTGNNFSFAGTIADLLTAAGLPDDASTLSLQGAVALSVDVDLETLGTNGITLGSTFIPADVNRVLYNVNTGATYSYDGTNWTASTRPVYYRKGTTYWNPMTDELFLATTTKSCVPFGTGTIVN